MLKRFMRMDVLTFVLFTIVAFAIVLLFLPARAFAQDGGGEQSIVALIVAALPGVIAMLWAWWARRAATSAATWDDASVHWIKSVAKAIVAGDAPPPPPPPSA